MKVCHLCGDTYKECVDFCFNDGEVLLPVEASESTGPGLATGDLPAQVNQSADLTVTEAMPRPHSAMEQSDLPEPDLTEDGAGITPVSSPNVAMPDGGLARAEVTADSFDEVVFATPPSVSGDEITEATEATAPLPPVQTSEAATVIDEDDELTDVEPPEVAAAAAVLAGAAVISEASPSAAETKPFPIPQAAIDAPERPAPLPDPEAEPNGASPGLMEPTVGGPPPPSGPAAAPPPPVPSTMGQTLPLTELSPPPDLDATAPRGRPVSQGDQVATGTPPPLDSHPHLSMPMAADMAVPADGGDRAGLVMLGIGIAGLVMVTVVMAAFAFVGMNWLSNDGQEGVEVPVAAVTPPPPRVERAVVQPRLANIPVPLSDVPSTTNVQFFIETFPPDANVLIDGNQVVAGEPISLMAGTTYPYVIHKDGFLASEGNFTIPPRAFTRMGLAEPIDLTPDEPTPTFDDDPLFDDELDPELDEPAPPEVSSPRPARPDPAPTRPAPQPAGTSEEPQQAKITPSEPPPVGQPFVTGPTGCSLLLDGKPVRASHVKGASDDSQVALPLMFEALTHGPHVLQVAGIQEKCQGEAVRINYTGGPAIELPLGANQ